MLELKDLSVGSVSGMIAAGVFFVQVFVPLALPLILLGLLTERNSSITLPAASWSVAGRFFHSSLWPRILGSDSATTTGQSRAIGGITLLSTLTTVLFGITAVVTPLGLYEGVSPKTETKFADFHYIKDTSPIGYGTPARGDVRFSRVCGGFTPQVCPHSNGNLTTTENSTGTYVSGDWYDTRIPQRVIDMFQSGLSSQKSSVSSIFDIQWRSYTYSTIDDGPNSLVIDNGTRYPVGAFRQISSLVLNDRIEAVEGLVVDTKDGGIGFRNHTAPPVEPFGSSWSEDILFIVPETQCVDTNLTLDFSVPLRSSESVGSPIANLVLTDRGGFTNLVLEYPYWDRNDTQRRPELWHRAYKAAWINNAWSMAFMNVTNLRNESDPDSKAFTYLDSFLGKRFPLQVNGSSSTTINIRPDSLVTSSLFGYYLSGTDMGVNGTKLSSLNITTPDKPPLYSNPWKVNSLNFSSANILCSGSGGKDLANITNIAAKCGLLYGAPQRVDGGESLIFEPGSNWTVPMYSCISVTKAVIKTVDFRFNGTDDKLSSLTVTGLREKQYPNEESKPLWAVEDTTMYLRDVRALWGLVSEEGVKGDQNISTIRKESLYLPGGGESSGLNAIDYQNLPGVNFYTDALGAAYEGVSSSSESYSGGNQLAMYRLWQELSRNASTVGKIKNLIWTDIALNAVTGTRSISPDKNNKQVLAKRDDGDSQSTNGIPITIYQRRVHYKYGYGVLAFISLVVIAGVFFLLTSLCILRRTGLSKTRKYLDETSVGRILAARSMISGSPRPGAGISREPTDTWMKSTGKTSITLGSDQPPNNKLDGTNTIYPGAAAVSVSTDKIEQSSYLLGN
ncbi:hypothetical protein MGYG_08489 [Nannizzia gypsea CBS 118893]|uniref:Uncharacterized protein n=1 Tax=Arthroderma gypseum (strain ATCC MYA-4604 / CBS 118893) TaxID=535722 RepID=E4V5V1_ARTGP|nr:hypothetical protein MGYG_08489 [Nannizzia gypsea CBS 118893]EFR05476.1 hypothetical protein MGYG_08489 [Nannizzia gypsea CBS 118893]